MIQNRFINFFLWRIIQNQQSIELLQVDPQGHGKAASQLKVRSDDKSAYGNENPTQKILSQDSEININSKWIKIYGPESGVGDEIINMVKL